MMLHCDHIQKQEFNIDRGLKHQRKLDEERIKEQDGIVRTLVRYMKEDLETISGSLNTAKDLKALGMLKEAVEIMFMQWEVVYDDFHTRQAAMLDDSFPTYKQLLNEKLNLYFQFAYATTGNKALLEKEAMKVAHVAAEAKSQSVIAVKEELIGKLNANITDLRNTINFLMLEDQAANHHSHGMLTNIQAWVATIVERMTAIETTNAELQSVKMKIKDLQKAVADNRVVMSQNQRRICELQQAIISTEDNRNMAKERSESATPDHYAVPKENAESTASLQLNAKSMENKMEAVNVSYALTSRSLTGLPRRFALALQRSVRLFGFTNAKIQKTNLDQGDQLKKFSLDLKTHKIQADELRFRNTELEKELEKRDNEIKELKNLGSGDARLAAQLRGMKNEVEVYKSIVKKEVDSSSDARLKDQLFDRILAALKAEKNKVEIYQLLLDQDVKYLNDNRLNGTLFEEGLHCNAPNKQYVRAKSHRKFKRDR